MKSTRKFRKSLRYAAMVHKRKLQFRITREWLKLVAKRIGLEEGFADSWNREFGSGFGAN